MSRRPAVLLDLDDTILDFHRAEAAALSRTLREMGLEPREEILRRYSAINRRQWELLEEGRQTREQTLTRRFEILFAEYGIVASGPETRDRYEENLSHGHYFMPGAEELLRTLYGRYELYIVSNGTPKVQAGRIASAGIAPYFEKIFISEHIGSNKPDARFFEACFSEIPGVDRERAIILGDSLTSDIRGGKNANILTCWYNPDRTENRSAVIPDYEICELSEFEGLLGRIFCK